MKSMNFLEFQAGVDRLQTRLLGSQLQDFSINDKEIVLLFYSGKPFALRLSLKTPPVFFFEPEVFKLTPNMRKVPMDLFLKKHFLRRTVLDVQYKGEWGRRFEIYFEKDSRDKGKVDIVMVPGFQNVGLFADEKQIHWQKPRPLPDLGSDSRTDVSEFRSLDQIRDEWYHEKKITPASSEASKEPESGNRKLILKKTQAIEKIILQGQENEILAQRMYAMGEQLKYQPISDLAAEDRKWIKERESTDWNREQLFKKAKLLTAKKEGMKARISTLQAEIVKLSMATEPRAPVAKHNNSISGSVSVDTRKLEIDKTISLYMGKNAKDNVQLLKSSQPWEFWFHLKDYPSAYAITRRNKGVIVGHSEMIKMATWFANECFKNKNEKSPSHIEVIVAETRFVKLLKGDRLGRVTFTNGKTLRISMK